jgi:hypothetical protein
MTPTPSRRSDPFAPAFQRLELRMREPSLLRPFVLPLLGLHLLGSLGAQQAAMPPTAPAALAAKAPRKTAAKLQPVKAPAKHWVAPPVDPDQAAADAFRHLRVVPSQVRQSVARVTRELTWHKTLGDAQKASRVSGKPIVWVQAFGDLRGFT